MIQLVPAVAPVAPARSRLYARAADGTVIVAMFTSGNWIFDIFPLDPLEAHTIVPILRGSSRRVATRWMQRRCEALYQGGIGWAELRG